MLPRQRTFNTRKQNSSRQGKYDNGVSPSKGKKKLVSKVEDAKGFGHPKYGKGNYSRVNSGEGRDNYGKGKGPGSRSIGKGDKGRKKSMDKKSSRGNLIGKKKGSKSSLSQNKRSRGGSQSKRKAKTKAKPESFYQVRD